MTTQRIYTLPVEQTGWAVNGSFETIFNWEYDDMRDRLITLYSKGKQKQWDAEVRIDWSQDLDPENPMELADEYLGIYGTDLWNKMTPKERVELRHHGQAWQISQFLHGEQGALICAAKIVETVPDIDSKFYAATQVIDEARHVEVYSRLPAREVRARVSDHGPAQGDARAGDPRLAVGLHVSRDAGADRGARARGVRADPRLLANPLASAVNAYVMQDEARHVAFGRLSLKDYYPQLTQKERDEREEFVVEASFLMRDRFQAAEVWQRLGFPEEDFQQYVDNAPIMVEFRKLLFTRIVPTIKDIGLWGPKVQRAYAEMGVIDFQAIDPDEASAADERFADELDARKAEIEQTISAGAE